MALLLAMTTELVRQPGRRRCAACHRRRNVFSLVSASAGGSGTAESPRLCGECAGIVKGDEPIGADEVMAAAETPPE